MTSIRHAIASAAPTTKDAVTLLIWIPISIAIGRIVALIAHSVEKEWLQNLLRALGAIGIVVCAGIVWFACQKLYEWASVITDRESEMSKSQFLELLVRELGHPSNTQNAEFILQFEHVSDSAITKMIGELYETNMLKQPDAPEILRKTEASTILVYRSGGGVASRSAKSGLGDYGRLMDQLAKKIFNDRNLCSI